MFILAKLADIFIFYKPWRKKLRNWIRTQFFLDYCLSSYPKAKHPIFHIINCHLGEAVIYALTSECWYKGGYVIGTKKYHQDMMRMICPEIPFILLPKKIKLPDFTTLSYKGYRFDFILSNPDLWKMNITKTPFFLNYQKYLGKDLSTLKYRKPIISPEAKKNAIRKLNKMGLSLENLVFLSEESQSMDLLPTSFWDSIKQKLHHKNLQFFTNKSVGTSDEVLTVEEAFFVASKSRMIIALRSGLIDLLCLADTPLRVIFGVKDLHVDIYPVYLMSVYPFCTKDLIEYNTNNSSLEKIEQQILSEIENI